MFHEFLEVEISDFIRLSVTLRRALSLVSGIILDHCQMLGVWFLDVRSNHFGNIGSSHFSVSSNTKEFGEFRRNSSRFYEATRSTGTLVLLRLALTLSMVLASRRTCFSRTRNSVFILLRLSLGSPRCFTNSVSIVVMEIHGYSWFLNDVLNDQFRSRS